MRKLLVPLLVGTMVAANAQDSAKVTEGFGQVDGFTGRKVVSAGIVAGMLAISLKWSYDTWWNEERVPFYFKTENWFNGEHRGIDKAGHLFTSYFYFHTLRNVMLWGGYSPSAARWWGAGAAAMFALTVELGDAVGGPGFDYQDLVFNAAGITYVWLQTDYPFLRNFGLKWSYIPRNRNEADMKFTKHYDVHTYWLTANVNELLPSSLEPLWPDFLQLAIGFGLDENMTKREFIFGLDFNLDVFSTHSEDLLLVRNTLNMFHYPAPAVKFTEDREPKHYLFHTN